MMWVRPFSAAGLMLIVLLSISFSMGTVYGAEAADNESMSYAELSQTVDGAYSDANQDAEENVTDAGEAYHDMITEPMLDTAAQSTNAGVHLGYAYPGVGRLVGLVAPVGSLLLLANYAYKRVKVVTA